MKWKVDLYIAGKVFHEIVIARSPTDAKQTALARNPTARVIGVNATFI
tara:strand:+ start:3230 stop:3373 length:144 start_codon:yes stop_codon:yes gene_type:complete